MEDPALLPQVIEAARSFSWTRGYLTAAGWLDWLANLPLEVRSTLPDGTRVLGVHASPGRDDGPGIQPEHSDGELEQRLAGCEADLVIVGHTHVPLDRRVGRIHVVNLGSISNPVTAGLQATYAVLDADEHGYRIQLRRVDYDHEAVIDAIGQSRHPTPDFLIGFMRGKRVASSDPGFFQAGKRAENHRSNEREQTTARRFGKDNHLPCHFSARIETISLRIAWAYKDTWQYVLIAEMALRLPGIGACPSSMGVLYSRYISKSLSVSLAFFTSTEEGLRWVSSTQGLEPFWS